jgi:hypothetical protein
LDRPRRHAISEAILNASQAIISATDIEDFSAEMRSRTRIFAVADNQVEARSGNGVSDAPGADSAEVASGGEGQ